MGLVLALVTAGCSGTPATCSAIPLAADAERELANVAADLDFEPLPPCAFRSSFTVRRVFVDTLPGDPPEVRVSFVVTRAGDDVFILSETRAAQPFSAIPQGTHRVRAMALGVGATGFAGPSGSGAEIVYLRWRVAGVTFELAGTLSPWLTERDVQAIAEALIAQAQSPTPLGQGGDE